MPARVVPVGPGVFFRPIETAGTTGCDGTIGAASSLKSYHLCGASANKERADPFAAAFRAQAYRPTIPASALFPPPLNLLKRVKGIAFS